MATYKKYKLKPKKSIDGKTLKPEERWMVKGYLGEDPKTGLGKYTTLRGFETKQAAKDAFDTATYEFKHAINQPRARVRVREVYAKWWPLYLDKVSPSTALLRQQQIEAHVIPKFGEYYIDAITILDLQSWRNDLAKQFRSYKNIFNCLSAMLTFAVQMQWIDSSPAIYVSTPKKVKASESVKDNYYSLDEAKQMLKVLDIAVSTNDKWIVRRVVLTLILSTGMRVGEATALKWSDVDFKHSSIKIQRAKKDLKAADKRLIGDPKSAAGFRTLYLDKHTLGLLAEWKNWQTMCTVVPIDGWIFPGSGQFGKKASNTISLATPGAWFKKLQDNYGLRHITIHGLRHTKASLMAEAGVNVSEIATILGHSDSSFTLKTYIHSTTKGIKGAETTYHNLFEPSGHFLGQKKA